MNTGHVVIIGLSVLVPPRPFSPFSRQLLSHLLSALTNTYPHSPLQPNAPNSSSTPFEYRKSTRSTFFYLEVIFHDTRVYVKPNRESQEPRCVISRPCLILAASLVARRWSLKFTFDNFPYDFAIAYSAQPSSTVLTWFHSRPLRGGRRRYWRDQAVPELHSYPNPAYVFISVLLTIFSYCAVRTAHSRLL